MKKVYREMLRLIAVGLLAFIFFVTNIDTAQAAGAQVKQKREQEAYMRQNSQQEYLKKRNAEIAHRKRSAQKNVNNKRVETSVSDSKDEPEKTQSSIASYGSSGKVLTSNNSSVASSGPETLSMSEYNYLVHVGKSVNNNVITRRVYAIIESLKVSPRLNRADYAFLKDLAQSINNRRVSNGLIAIAETHKP